MQGDGEENSESCSSCSDDTSMHRAPGVDPETSNQMELVVVDMVNPRLARFKHTGTRIAVFVLFAQLIMTLSGAFLQRCIAIDELTVLMDQGAAVDLVRSASDTVAVKGVYTLAGPIVSQVFDAVDSTQFGDSIDRVGACTGSLRFDTSNDCLDKGGLCVWDSAIMSRICASRREVLETYFRAWESLCLTVNKASHCNFSWGTQEVNLTIEPPRLLIQTCTSPDSPGPFSYRTLDGLWHEAYVPSSPYLWTSFPLPRAFNATQLEVLGHSNGVCFTKMMISTGESVGDGLPRWFDVPCDEYGDYHYECNDTVYRLHFKHTVELLPAVITSHIDERFPRMQEDLHQRAASLSMEFPCKLHGVSCDEYRAFKGAVDCTQYSCQNSIVSVKREERPSWMLALLSSFSLIAYYEILVTAIILGIFLLHQKTAATASMSLHSAIRILMESRTHEEMAALHNDD